jgi:hypothetical protein
MRVHDAALLFVASHLASGDAEGDELRRNADVAEILRRCTFASEQQPSECLQVLCSPLLPCFCYDHLTWA